MENDPGFFHNLGLHIQAIIGGGLGGVASSFLRRLAKPVEIIGTVYIGMFTANYFHEAVEHYLGVSEQTAGAILGITGVIFCQFIVDKAKEWRLFQAKGPAND
jgi:hypothetical protein